MTEFQKLELASGRKSLIDTHSFIISFRCLVVVAVRDRMLGQNHPRSSPELLFLCSHEDLGGTLAKMEL